MVKKKSSNQMGGLLGSITSMGTSSMLGAGMQIGLGSMAATPGIGAPAVASLTAGQVGITNMTSMFPAMGTIQGVGTLMGSFGNLSNMAKKAKF